MNDDDRSDLERLIAAVRPAGPSGELDARVRDALSAASLHQPERRKRRPDRRLWLSVAASALIAASVGFLGGRLTAGGGHPDLAQKDPSPEIATPLAPIEATEKPGPGASDAVSPTVTTFPLNDERLAALFLRPRSREGLLGAGPVWVETSRLP